VGIRVAVVVRAGCGGVSERGGSEDSGSAGMTIVVSHWMSASTAAVRFDDEETCSRGGFGLPVGRCDRAIP
jgi:hypothetical protein